MITIEYQPDIAETTKATLDFLERRPLVKIMMLLMKTCCFIMSVAYILKIITGVIISHDLLILLFALTWLFGQRSINNILLKKTLTRKNINKTIKKIHVNQYKLCWQSSYNKQPMQQLWKQVKYIYQNKDGYIIPSIGAANAGKFIWLPKRGFTESDAEQQFLDLLGQLKIKIK